jgi:hypothetical protein
MNDINNEVYDNPKAKKENKNKNPIGKSITDLAQN